MPFLHVHIESTGKVKACCVSNINLGNIKNSSIDEIWSSTEIIELRKKFLADQKDNRCSNCYQKEASGNESLRTETLSKYAHLIPDVTAKPSPIYFDIRFSNICNLKCRTCWHGNSSKWFEDAKALNRAISEKAKISAFDSDDELKKKLHPYLDTAVEFYFAGGEPLLMEEHLFVLNSLIERGNFGCLLRYNTNLTNLHQFDQDLLEKWKNFKNIEILASIDGLGEKGIMIRSGLDFDKFESNFRKLKELPNISIKLAPTFSLLSAELLPKLHQYFFTEKLIDINDIHFNILHQPFFYNVKSLPLEKKKMLTVKLKNHILWIKNNNGNTTDWENAIAYMNQDDWSNRYQKTLQETTLLNKLRKEDFKL